MLDIRSIRKADLKVSQAELAKMLGVHQATISRLETGEQPLDVRTQLAIEALREKAKAA
jgi:predicted transcriptional regulator